MFDRTRIAAGKTQTPLPCHIEQLENRLLMAGTVTVAFAPNKVTIKGDSADNAISITAGGVSGAAYTISGLNDTNVVTKGIPCRNSPLVDFQISLGGGADSVTMSAMKARKIKIDSGSEADIIALGDRLEAFGDLTIAGGAGNDTLRLSAGDYWGKTKIDAGAGDDTLSIGYGIAGAITLGIVDINMNAGNDVMSISCDPAVASPVTIYMLGVKLGTGDDALNMGGGDAGNAVTIDSATTIDMGAGNDELNIDPAGDGVITSFGAGASTFNFGAGDDTTSGLTGSSMTFSPGASVWVIGGAGAESAALRSGFYSADYGLTSQLHITW